jgi:hypothetical protein
LIPKYKSRSFLKLLWNNYIGGLNMGKDSEWSVFLSDESRYADFINGFALNGQQIVKEDDIQELDTRMFLRLWLRDRYTGKTRDILRRAVFGVNFVIVGVEDQEHMDYSYPARNLAYDAGEYEKQMRKLKKYVRHHAKGLSAGEFLYGFRKEDSLHPVITFVLYTGEEAWEKPRSLWDILDFTDIPEELRGYVPDYRINVIDVRRLKDTSMFNTDLKAVLDFLRCADNDEKLKSLVESEPYFQNMEEDAFDVVTSYTHAGKLKIEKEKFQEGGRVNMIKALEDWERKAKEEGRKKGQEEGQKSGVRIASIRFIFNMHRKGYSVEEIADVSEKSVDEVRDILKKQ